MLWASEAAALIRDPKIIQICFILLLRRQAGIHQITLSPVPFLQPAIIEQFQIILDDERDHIIFQALFEQDQSAHTDVSIPPTSLVNFL